MAVLNLAHSIPTDSVCQYKFDFFSMRKAIAAHWQTAQCFSPDRHAPHAEPHSPSIIDMPQTPAYAYGHGPLQSSP